MAKKTLPVNLTPMGLEIKSITVRETDGDDLIRAAERCAPPSGGKIDDNTFSLLLRLQQIAGAIVEVDGQKVPGGSCQAFLRWNDKTRKRVTQIYDRLNGGSEADDALFSTLLEAAANPGEQPSTPASSAPGSSASGSASQPSYAPDQT